MKNTPNYCSADKCSVYDPKNPGICKDCCYNIKEAKLVNALYLKQLRGFYEK